MNNNHRLVYFDIYYILSSPLLKEHLNFSLSDTILFSDSSHVIWLFSSKKDNSLKKKKSNKLKIKQIIDKFTRSNKGTIKAFFMHCSNDDNTNLQNTFNQPISNETRNLQEFLEKMGLQFEKKEVKTSLLLFEYFTKDELVSFLMNQKKKQGILQLYVEMKTLTNQMFRIIYNDNLSFYDVRRSRHDDNHRNLHDYEKVITFETDKFNIQTG